MAGTIDDNQESTIEEAVRQFVDAKLQGRELDIDDFVKRYPGLEHQIKENIQELQKINTLFDCLTQAEDSDFEDAAPERELVGRKVGSFEIVEMIGRGGMGVVYLAHDTKLDRSVAVKSIPAELQASSTAQARFQREAKLLASLNHPNIAAIHDIIEQDESAGYLILEYVPGETLAQRIAREPLTVEEALSIGWQVAEAVSAAHENGVIHRDLKPGNIKITPEGKVKVLDFGLAKVAVGEDRSSEITVTQPGRVIGTPAYMSPEQACGKPTDKRSDIWSFGCIMYQMLTGHIPFDGETATEIVALIIEREPDWGILPESTPMNIRALIRRCLTKDPRRRLRDIGDAGIEIDETLNLPATASPVTISSAVVSRPAGLQRLMVWAAACLILIVVVTSLVTWSLTRPSPPPHQPTRQFVIRPETRLAFGALYHHALALSPDGKRLAYVEEGSDKRGRIYLRELDEFKARSLPGTESAIDPFFSPDGQWLGYVDHHQRKLKKVSVKGGEPMILADSRWCHGGSWGEDDTIIFTPEFEGLWRVSASGEGLEQLTIPDPNQGESGHFWPQILPGGKAVLFTNRRKGGLDEYQVEIYSLETGQRRPLFKGGTYARYVPTGHIVYARKETLYAVCFDIGQLKVVGSAFTVVPDVTTSHPWFSMSAQFAVAQDGTLAYIPVQARSDELRPVWVDRNGQVEHLPAATPRHYDNVTISPDGMQVAFTILDGENWDVWIYDFSRGTLYPLSSDGQSIAPIWTPDGKRVMFRSYRTGKDQLLAQSVDGSGKPELIATLEAFGYPTSCSVDGKEILLVTNDPNSSKRDQDISVLVLEQEEGPCIRPFIRRDLPQRGGVWSPDGRWIAYNSSESRRWDVYVESYPGPGPKILISTEGGYQPVWSHDGKELFYRSSNKMMAVSIETEPEFKVTQFEELFEGRYLTSIYRNYDVAPDGRFLMIQEPQESTPLGINVVLNWFEELKRLVPPGKE